MPRENLKAFALQSLLMKHEITFEGPVEQEHWPPQHTILFRRIAKIGTLGYSDYIQKSQSQDLARTKIRVETLVRAAYQCLENQANELEWRLITETKVFSRLEDDIVW